MHVRIRVTLSREELKAALAAYVEEKSEYCLPDSNRPDLCELDVFPDGSGAALDWKEDE